MKTILITGGIGSGKSVVARIVHAMGYPVYDCDSQARRIMETSAEVKDGLVELLGTGVLDGDSLNRSAIASAVFNDKSLLQRLNSLVHGKVREDITRWLVDEAGRADKAFIETAIPVTAAIDSMVDETWLVTAPLEVRLRRVTTMRHMEADDFMSRVKSQEREIPETRELKIIENDGATPVLPRVEELLRRP